MEMHDRLMKLPTTGVNVLQVLAENREKESAIFRNLMTAYNTKISKNVTDLKTLETYRMILCYEYQSLVNSRNGDDPPKCTGHFYTDLKNFFVEDNEHRKGEEFAVLYDIAVLQLVFSNKQLLRTCFKDFCETPEFLSSTESRTLAMIVSECFVDSYNLHTFLYKSMNNSAELDEHSARILKIIQSWMKQEDGLEWKLLASLLPKLTIAFGPEKIVSPLWCQVIGSSTTLPPFHSEGFVVATDIDKKLAALCVMADVCFPLEEEKVRQLHYEQCVQQEFWLTLNRGLTSMIHQHRKQALYLVNRALDFADTHKSEIKRMLLPLKNSAMPFLCIRSEADKSSLEEAKRKFFLILEVLEEKQKHLVLPALSHLPSLVKVHADHKSCCDSFTPIWLCCIFKRIIQHDNDSVKILGLQEILKSDSRIFFDNEFLHFLVGALNNTFLYDYSVDEERPEIVKKLEECLLRWEQEKVTLINSFVRALSTVSWGPVAIYWILQALLRVSEQSEVVTNIWGNEELHCVEDLIKKSLMTHNLQLRTYSQVLITRIFRAYVSKSVDTSTLGCIFNILSSFRDNVCLKPDSEEWRKITKHLSKIIKPSDALRYFTERCENLVTIEQSLKSFALTICLLMDSNLIFVAKPCPAEKVFRNLLDNLVGADLRPYADQDLILKVIELSGHLFSNLSPPKSDGTLEVRTLMSPYGYEIFKIVSKSLDRKTISSYDEYFFAISALVNSAYADNLVGSRGSIWINVIEELARLEEKCIRIISNPHDFCRTQWSYAIKILKLCRYNNSCYKPNVDKIYVPLLLKYFINQITSKGRVEDAAQQNESPKGKFAPDCFETVAELVNKSINVIPVHLWPSDVHWFQELLAIVENGNEHVIKPVANSLYRLLEDSRPLTTEEVESVLSIVRVSCRCLFQLKKSPVFFSALVELTRVIMSSWFLDLDGAKDLAVECVDQMMQEGESVPALKQIFITPKSHFVMESEHLLIFQKALMSCLLHGSVPRRDQIIERAAILHARQIDDKLSFVDFNVDPTIRAQAVVNLLDAISWASEDTARLREKVLNNLLEILERNKNKRYFDNSHLHRLKHRVMQTLLALEPFLNEAETRRLYDALCDFLIAESNQPSVRLMQEWLLVRLYLKNANLRETTWALFETATEKRPGSIVSLASVVFHVARSLSEQTQTEYIGKAISQLLPNCMGQQFSVRLYSQAILVKIYKMLPEESWEAQSYRTIFTGVEESLRRGNLMKNSTRVLDDFYFKIFDATAHYSFETIYYELPRLTNVSNDEWISHIVFDNVDSNKGFASVYIEKQYALRLAKPTAKSSRATGELDENADSAIDSGLSDIQKKIIPWKTIVPFYGDLSEVSRAKLLRRKAQNEEAGIIVVASLIDRPPNLGGIARTCEIFGAKELVIGSLRYAEDREFQTLSVSAEKWITITEVKPHLLKNYLLEKQSEGWKLIGAEQTANSTNLLEMEFPKKTILLLGNEKDGIPANLIPLLDVCVEIPQDGVVRSLNVHVTGAICIWQYAKQHVLT